MSPERSTQPVHRFFDVLDAHDVDGAVDLLGTAYQGIDVSQSVLSMGPGEARNRIESGLAAFPDLSFSMLRVVAEDAAVSAHWRMEATHEGAFLHVPPTGQSMSISGVGLFTVREGQITRGVWQWDVAGFLRAVKLLPELPTGTLSPAAFANIDQ